MLNRSGALLHFNLWHCFANDGLEGCTQTVVNVMKGTQHAMSESETYAGVPFWRNSFMVQSLTGATVRAWYLSGVVWSISHCFGIEATTAPRRQKYATNTAFICDASASED